MTKKEDLQIAGVCISAQQVPQAVDSNRKRILLDCDCNLERLELILFDNFSSDSAPIRKS